VRRIEIRSSVVEDRSFSAWAGQIATLLSSTDLIDYRNGGGLSPRKLTGQDKFGEITLNRGIVPDQYLSNWANARGSGLARPVCAYRKKIEARE
jgi:hypothetical protein